jgi:AraC family transcriptional regulator of adaptative response/methylated-DNA-[protein]-cysteine methyltransferase
MRPCWRAVPIMRGGICGGDIDGYFCHLTCGARKPKPENCQFFGTAADCIVVGFHGCRRCRPLTRLEQAKPSIAILLAALEALPARQWSEADWIGMGFDPSAAIADGPL